MLWNTCQGTFSLFLISLIRDFEFDPDSHFLISILEDDPIIKIQFVEIGKATYLRFGFSFPMCIPAYLGFLIISAYMILQLAVTSRCCQRCSAEHAWIVGIFFWPWERQVRVVLNFLIEPLDLPPWNFTGFSWAWIQGCQGRWSCKSTDCRVFPSHYSTVCRCTSKTNWVRFLFWISIHYCIS